MITMLTKPKFFKKDNNIGGAEEFKKCLPVNVNTSFTTMAPAIATVEQQRLKPFLGQKLFDKAATYYESSGTEGSDQVMNELVALIQMAVVRLAYWDSFDQLSVMMSDDGISDTHGENRAYRYQADRLKESLLRQGFAYLNQAIGWCMENIEKLPEFTESEYYSERQESVIHSLKEFEKIASLNGDFFLFSKMREYIAQTESMELPFRIGQSLTELLTKHRDDQRAERLLRSAQGFVAHWSLAEAVPFLCIVITPQGPVVVSEESTGSVSGKVSNPPRTELIGALQQRHRDMAERYIGQLVTFCKQNTNDYPEIAEIGIATNHEKTALHRDNRGKKTFLV